MTQFTTHDIAKLGTILSIWAHPDDESYSCAGIMCIARANGQRVVCITATKGEAGVQNEDKWPAEKLADIRAEEMDHALQILGVTEHHWLNYRDGCCCDVENAEAIKRLKAFIEEVMPDTILTFGPEGMTGHPDHCTVSKWVSDAAHSSGARVYHAVQLKSRYEYFKEADERFNIFFNIDNPPFVADEEVDLLFDLPDECLKKKFAALKAMPSQTEAMFTAMGEEAICKMVRVEAFVLEKD